MHVLIESAISGIEINRKYRRFVPLFSYTILPAIEATAIESAAAAMVMTEGLAVCKGVASSDKAVEVYLFDLVSAPKAPKIRLSSWISGEVVDASRATGRSLCGLTSMAPFNDSAHSILKATQELRDMYPSSVPTPLQPVERASEISPTTEFAIPTKSRVRLLAPNPVIFTRMMNMPKSKFISVYKKLLYELHDEGVARNKWQEK